MPKINKPIINSFNVASSFFFRYKELEKLLPAAFKERDLRFIIVDGDGTYSELFAAILLSNLLSFSRNFCSGHGWDNASMLLGGINGFLEAMKKDTKFLAKESLPYDPQIDMERAIIVENKKASCRGVTVNILTDSPGDYV